MPLDGSRKQLPKPVAKLPKKFAWIAASGIALYFLPSQIQIAPSTIRTLAGEWPSVALPDGTLVRMTPNSEIKIDFDSDERRVEQIQGRNFYEIFHDPARPFSVHTDSAVVTAIGTRFGVDERSDQKTVVTIDDGRVAIESVSDRWGWTDGPSIRAGKGQEVVVETDRPMVAKSVNVDEQLAWQNRRIHFHKTPFAEAIAEFNRCNEVQLEVPPELKALAPNVYGYFKLDEPAEFERYLRQLVEVLKQQGVLNP